MLYVVRQERGAATQSPNWMYPTMYKIAVTRMLMPVKTRRWGFRFSELSLLSQEAEGKVMVDREIVDSHIAVGTDFVVVAGTEQMVVAGTRHFPPLLKGLSRGQPSGK